jgi:putative oxidoreductase
MFTFFTVAGANGNALDCQLRENSNMSRLDNFLHNDYLELFVRLAIGAIFIYASLDKIAAPAQFARIVYNYHLVPGELINLLAIIMPWVELICGISVILGIYKEGGILIIGFLLCVFAVSIGINLVRGVDLECGCFTVSSRAKSNALELLLRDIGYMILIAYLMINRSQRFDIVKTK